MGLASRALQKARKQTKQTGGEEDIDKTEVRTRPQVPFLFPGTAAIIFCFQRLQAMYYIFPIIL